MDRWIDIPEEVSEAYKLWRPTPLFRALGLEKALKTPARIYYKYEGVSPAGSHKPNTAVAQAYYNMKRESNASAPKPALTDGIYRFGVRLHAVRYEINRLHGKSEL